VSRGAKYQQTQFPRRQRLTEGDWSDVAAPHHYCKARSAYRHEAFCGDQQAARINDIRESTGGKRKE
jgi:hypothetical protein